MKREWTWVAEVDEMITLMPWEVVSWLRIWI
jgi:hypothetical protein